MKVTDKQWEVAKATIDEWDLRNKKSKQPWFVLNAKGEELMSDYSAVCLADLNSEWETRFSHKGAVLFQVINTSMEYVKQNTISKFLTYMCNNSPVSKYIPKHTSKKRWEVGAVPIALEGVPNNLPITASTYVRWLWDAHNTEYAKVYEWLMNNVPNITRAQAFLLANCLDYCPKEENRDTFNIRVADGIHTPFCVDMSIESMKCFFNKCYLWDKKNFDTKSPNTGTGIHRMLSKGGGGDFSDWLRDITSDVPKVRGDWGGPTSIKVEDYFKTIDLILNGFKELMK